MRICAIEESDLEAARKLVRPAISPVTSAPNAARSAGRSDFEALIRDPSLVSIWRRLESWLAKYADADDTDVAGAMTGALTSLADADSVEANTSAGTPMSEAISLVRIPPRLGCNLTTSLLLMRRSRNPAPSSLAG